MTLEDVAMEDRFAHLASSEGNVGFTKPISVVNQLRNCVQRVPLNNLLKTKCLHITYPCTVQHNNDFKTLKATDTDLLKTESLYASDHCLDQQNTTEAENSLLKTKCSPA